MVTVTIPNNHAYYSKDNAGGARPLLYIDSSNNTVVEAAGNNVISLRDNGGTERAKVTTGGIILSSGTLSLLTGSVSRISKFTNTATTTATFFNHGLGVIPDIVMLQLNGLSSTVHSLWADYASMTSTQVKIQSDGSNAFVGLAIKF